MACLLIVSIFILDTRASNPALEKVVQTLRKHSQNYCTALDLSIETAQDGQTFSTRAIDLCDFLLDDDVETEDLIEYIEEMQSGAKKAHQDSESTMGMFRAVRVGVHEVRSRCNTLFQSTAFGGLL